MVKIWIRLFGLVISIQVLLLSGCSKLRDPIKTNVFESQVTKSPDLFPICRAAAAHWIRRESRSHLVAIVDSAFVDNSVRKAASEAGVELYDPSAAELRDGRWRISLSDKLGMRLRFLGLDEGSSQSRLIVLTNYGGAVKKEEFILESNGDQWVVTGIRVLGGS